MYFCDDVDLMVWEPAIFGDASFAHQALVKSAAGTLTGTTLATAAGALAAAAPGMIALAESGGASQLLEVVAVADSAHATLSALRGRADETPIPGLLSGAVGVTIVSFRPQIAAIGDELLGVVGVASDRDGAAETVERPRGFRMAAVFGTLASIFRVLAAADGATAAQAAKRDFYEKTYAQVRLNVRGRVDGRPVSGAVCTLERE